MQAGTPVHYGASSTLPALPFSFSAPIRAHGGKSTPQPGMHDVLWKSTSTNTPRCSLRPKWAMSQAGRPEPRLPFAEQCRLVAKVDELMALCDAQGRTGFLLVSVCGGDTGKWCKKPNWSGLDG